MQINLSFYKNILIVSPIGELDHHNIEKHTAETDRCFKMRGFKYIIFNLEGVTFIDSSGIGYMLGRYKLALFAGGSAAAVNPSEQVRKIIKISGLLKIIKIYPNLDKAIENITRGGEK